MLFRSPWGSYRATAGQTKAHALLTTDWILGNFSRSRKIAQEKYKAFVQIGKDQMCPWESLKNQIYLGPDKFVEKMQCKINPEQSLKDIPKPQKSSPVKPLTFYKEKYTIRTGQWRKHIVVATIPWLKLVPNSA